MKTKSSQLSIVTLYCYLKTNICSVCVGQVYQMFREWKLKEGGNARVDVLERALREGGMVDVSLALGP